MRVLAYLHPNPPLEGSTLTDIWGRGYPMRNEPFLEVVLCDLPPGEHGVEILSPVRGRRTFEAPSGLKTLFFPHPAFVDPTLSEVRRRSRCAWRARSCPSWASIGFKSKSGRERGDLMRRIS